MNRSPRQPSVIALANTKGGAGKTSAVISLGYAATQAGARVLLVDLDDSCALTYGLHRTEAPSGRSIGGDLIAGARAGDAILTGLEPGLDLYPANTEDVLACEFTLRNRYVAGLRAVRELLDRVKDRYDLVLVDTPGGLGTLQMAGVAAADWVIVPVSPRRDHVLAGQRAIELTLEAARDVAPVQVGGVLRTLVEKPHSISTQVGAELTGQLADTYGVPVFTTAIPVESRYTESEFRYRPVGAVDPMSRTAIAYRALLDELDTRGLARMPAVAR